MANQTFWQQVLDVGVIEFFTSGDDAECTLPGMPDPDTIRAFVQLRAIKLDRAEA